MPHIQFERVSDQMVMLTLDRRHAPCDLHCRFCPRTYFDAPRDLPPPSDRARAEIRAELERLVALFQVPDFFFIADDALAYPDLFDLLDVFRDHGRRVLMATPGTRLGDRAFAERLAGYDVRFDLTYHAVDDAVFARMAGRDDARAQIEAGLDHLGALGIEHALAIVVTAENVGDLAATVRHLAARFSPPKLYLRVFYPDLSEAEAWYFDQFPAFDDVLDQLAALRGTPDLPDLVLSNFPLCQLDEARVAGLPLQAVAQHNTHPVAGPPPCATCPAREGCARLHPAYLARHPAHPVDHGAVARRAAIFGVPEDAA